MEIERHQERRQRLLENSIQARPRDLLGDTEVCLFSKCLVAMVSVTRVSSAYVHWPWQYVSSNFYTLGFFFLVYVFFLVFIKERTHNSWALNIHKSWVYCIPYNLKCSSDTLITFCKKPLPPLPHISDCWEYKERKVHVQRRITLSQNVVALRLDK